MDRRAIERKRPRSGIAPAVAICCGLLMLAAVVVVVTVALRATGGGQEPALAAAEAEPAGPPIRVAWVGDTMLGHDGAVAPDGGRALFENVRPWLRKPDLTLGNLEGVLASTGTSKCAGSKSKACFAFRAPPSTAAALRWAGFDAMNLANNHAMDYGQAALDETVAALREQGIASTGRPGQITVVRVRGIRVALVGLAPYPWAQSSLDLVGAANLVRRARSQADIVIAMIHAGAEGRDQTHTPVGVETAFGENRGDARALGHTLASAGASLVLGSGPHVVRGIERHDGRLIAYSLGNFAGWHNFASNPVANQTGVLEVRLSPAGRVLGGRWRSAEIAPPGVPAPQKSRISSQLARSVSITDFGEAAWPMTPRGRLAGWRDEAP